MDEPHANTLATVAAGRTMRLSTRPAPWGLSCGPACPEASPHGPRRDRTCDPLIKSPSQNADATGNDAK